MGLFCELSTKELKFLSKWLLLGEGLKMVHVEQTETKRDFQIDEIELQLEQKTWHFFVFP